MKLSCTLFAVVSSIMLTFSVSAQKRTENYPDGFPQKGKAAIEKLYPGIEFNATGIEQDQYGITSYKLGFTSGDTTISVKLSSAGEILQAVRSFPVTQDALPSAVKQTSAKHVGSDRIESVSRIIDGQKSYYSFVVAVGGKSKVENIRTFDIDETGAVLASGDHSVEKPDENGIMRTQGSFRVETR